MTTHELVVKAFCEGLRPTAEDYAKYGQPKPRKVDFPTPSPKPIAMNVSAPQINLIAASYGVTRQRVHQLRQRHGLTVADFREPETVFSKLLTGGRASKLRKVLLNPANRAAIRDALNTTLP
jgi:hypothetical protein